MPPRQSTKRSASNADQSSSKKTRFLDPQDDPVNFAEEVDSQLEDPANKRKGKVKTEGYDSDSSDDGEGVVNSRKAAAAEADDDDDMFAMGDKLKDESQSAKKPKDEYLRLGDIEGQEFGKSGLGDELSDVEDEELLEEDEIERRKKAGMGFELSSFNMREEMEEGKFSADGMYVRSFDPHAVHDRWMEGVDDKEIKRARKSRREREKIEQDKIEAEEKELEELGGKVAVEKELLSKLKKGETVLEALQRLGAAAKVESKSKKTKKHQSSGSDMSVDKLPTQKSQAPKSDIDLITHLASTLMSLGDTDIYSKEYEQLVRSVRASGQVDPSWDPPSADVKYEYRWAITDTGETFGPFSEEEMKAWYGAAYFGSVGEKVKIRPVGGSWGDWDDVIT